jgi:hypothetical protein
MPGAINIDTAGIGQAVGAIGGLLKDARAAITGKSVTDPAAQAAFDQATLAIEAEVAKAQAAIDAAEAAKGGFAGTWRPALGWVCVAAFAFKYLFAPFLTYFGLAVPSLDTSELYPLLFGMLGLVASRSFDKVKGVAS